MINLFVSRPNWLPSMFEQRLNLFYDTLQRLDFKPHTIGVGETPIELPFDEVRDLMAKCQCTVVLGLPQIFMKSGSIKNIEINGTIVLPTEWNHMEATMSLMMGLPTLALVHRGLTCRGIFDRGASRLFIHEFDVTKNWPQSIVPALEKLKGKI